MTLADFSNLLRANEHALDLGGLIGAAHPALDPHVGAAAGAPARKRGAEVTDRKAYPGMVGIERGYDDLADFALAHRIAGAGLDDFEDQILIHHQAFTRRSLVGNQAEIGGAECLKRLHAVRLE